VNTIVLLSGGIDSAVCLHDAVARYGAARVRALAIDYGQRHATELVSARRIARSAGVDLAEATATIPWRPSALTGGGGDVVVPGRNLILATIAAAYVPDGTVVMGCCADDYERFPDCRSTFVEALSETLRLAMGTRVETPVLLMSKVDILRRARRSDGVWRSIELSWSCYAPQDAGARRPTKCGACLACTTRAQAFAEIGEPDPAR
jgi:7-cyano-7-deazaguanine synthase